MWQLLAAILSGHWLGLWDGAGLWQPPQIWQVPGQKTGHYVTQLQLPWLKCKHPEQLIQSALPLCV